MRSLSEIFWRLSWNDCILDPNNFKYLVCLSVYLLAYFLTEIRLIQGYLQFQLKYLSEIFSRHSQDISGLFRNYFDIVLKHSRKASKKFQKDISSRARDINQLSQWLHTDRRTDGQSQPHLELTPPRGSIEKTRSFYLCSRFYLGPKKSSVQSQFSSYF